MSSPSSAPALPVRGWASEKLFLGMCFWEYVKSLATPGNFLAGLIMAIGLPLLAASTAHHGIKLVDAFYPTPAPGAV